MKTKNIFKMLAFAMLMPAMMLTTACSSDDSITNTPEKTENTTGKVYEIPITINATRQDTDATRAEYNTSTNKLEFTTGDQLFVSGSHDDAGDFSGTLNWDGGTAFSGTIRTENPYQGTAIQLLNSASDCSATLLPKGYTNYSYFTKYKKNPDNPNSIELVTTDVTSAFTTSKTTAIEQFSLETATWKSYDADHGLFALAPENAILNFTITGLTPNSTSTTVSFHYPKVNSDIWINKTVQTDNTGTATFAIGIYLRYALYENLKNFSLSVDGKDITLVTENTTLKAGHIYNITRSASGTPTPDPDPTPDAGQFSVSATKKVTFSPGNLQATWDGSSWNWHFAENQWDYIGNAEGNTKVTNTTPFVSGYSGTSTTVDLFGWVGASSGFTGAAQYGITSSDNEEDYGNFYGEALKSDWGNTMGSGWRTLTRSEWYYVFFQRKNTTSGVLFVKATVNGVNGVILLPDDWNTSYASLNHTTSNYNEGEQAYDTNVISLEDWSSKFAAHGCVFLPAAGRRYENTVDLAGSRGFYWSSSSLLTPDPTSETKYAHPVQIFPFLVDPASEWSYSPRTQGFSVRLVRDVQ